MHARCGASLLFFSQVGATLRTVLCAFLKITRGQIRRLDGTLPQTLLSALLCPNPKQCPGSTPPWQPKGSNRLHLLGLLRWCEMLHGTVAHVFLVNERLERKWVQSQENSGLNLIFVWSYRYSFPGPYSLPVYISQKHTTTKNRELKSKSHLHPGLFVPPETQQRTPQRTRRYRAERLESENVCRYNHIEHQRDKLRPSLLQTKNFHTVVVACTHL